MALNKYCPVCYTLMNQGLQDWHSVCAMCGYENAEFEPMINNEFAHSQIDEIFREKGLRTLRGENFDRLLHAITASGHSSGRLLDVGCAHGWFLDVAQKYGFDVLGIEPDKNVFESTVKRGLPIRQGFFPQALDHNEKFDIIVFNDVFEHIPDLNYVLDGCRNHLKVGGVLALNLPSSLGPFYKTSRILQRLGINKFFDRLWQKGYPSPHLHYFNPNNLRLLLGSAGFEEIAGGRLSTLHIRGLFARISHTGGHSLPTSLGITFLAAMALPVLRVMPSDIVYSIFIKSK